MILFGAARLDNHGVELRTRLITGSRAIIRLRRAHPGRWLGRERHPMKRVYDNDITRYYCKRCRTPIEVESDRSYWFTGPDDPEFWCSACQDLPQAETLGTPAENLPTRFLLPKGFLCRPVPLVELSEIRNANLLYRPYSKRSFLRQYADWLVLQGLDRPCLLRSQVLAGATFDPQAQEYTTAIDYQITDGCGERSCAFLRLQAVSPTELECQVAQLLCDTRGQYGLCQTGDEACFSGVT